VTDTQSDSLIFSWSSGAIDLLIGQGASATSPMNSEVT
jgi:hypothetical protein